MRRVKGAGTVRGNEKNAELNIFGKAESALMQTVGVARHTLTNTHAVGFPVGPRRTVPGFVCVGMSCWTGQLLEQRLLVALWSYYMVQQSSTNNMDRMSHFPLPPQIITYHRNLGIFAAHSCHRPLTILILHIEIETHAEHLSSFFFQAFRPLVYCIYSVKHKSILATSQLAAVHTRCFIVLCLAVCCR